MESPNTCQWGCYRIIFYIWTLKGLWNRVPKIKSLIPTKWYKILCLSFSFTWGAGGSMSTSVFGGMDAQASEAFVFWWCKIKSWALNFSFSHFTVSASVCHFYSLLPAALKSSGNDQHQVSQTSDASEDEKIIKCSLF